MTEKVTVKQAGQLPMPLIYLASPEDWPSGMFPSWNGPWSRGNGN